MTKEQRNELRQKIVDAIDQMTEHQTNRQSVVTIGGHTISRRLVYAGGSQWTGCGRDWDEVESGWAWIIDDIYRLESPKLFGFDGNNFIERQTGYYLQDGYDPQTVPVHDGRDELDTVPRRVLLEIGRGLAEAQAAAKAERAKEAAEATDILSKLE